MKTSREQFEEWFAPKSAQMERNGLGTISRSRARSAAWDAWQASRAAIEITKDSDVRIFVDGENLPLEDLAGVITIEYKGA